VCDSPRVERTVHLLLLARVLGNEILSAGL
jgi:hypothetical protein